MWKEKKKLSLSKFPDIELKKLNHRNIVSDEYKGLSGHAQRKKAALKSSDNGRCWWIYDFLMIERGKQ